MNVNICNLHFLCYNCVYITLRGGKIMGMKIGQLITELEKPENAGEIKHLTHLKNLGNLDELKQMKGIGGFITKIVLSFTRKHMDAFMALSECETTADITAFKQTAYFDKIKNATLGDNLSLKELARLEELTSLRDINLQ